LSDNNNQVYFGTFLNNLPHGYGELIWLDTSNASTRTSVNNATSTSTVNNPLVKASSNIYRGQFQYGMRHGYGSFFYANSSQYHGFWSENKKHGNGLFIQTNGDISYVFFENDRLLNQKSYSGINTINGGSTNKRGRLSAELLRSNTMTSLETSATTHTDTTTATGVTGKGAAAAVEATGTTGSPSRRNSAVSTTMTPSSGGESDELVRALVLS
jgi:hypothetical protein